MNVLPKPVSATTLEHRAIARLADLLHALAGQGSVRTREALAAALVNRASALSRGTPGSDRPLAPALLACVDEVARPAEAAPAVQDLAYETSSRIARRAVNGALGDPTDGAVRWHHLRDSPDWASGLVPSAWIGDFLFYKAFESSRAAGDGVRTGRGCRLDSAASMGRAVV